MDKAMTENEDYYMLPDGRLVFTAAYLLKRGYCCGNGCLNCPFDYINVPEPEKTKLIREQRIHEKNRE
jgi:hypothetical protein